MLVRKGHIVDTFDIRRATFDDLDAIIRVQIEASVAVGEPDPGPNVPVPNKLVHNLRAGDLFVAERCGELLGFGGAFSRGQVRFLAYLYTVPDVQQRGAGVGRALLNVLMPPTDQSKVVVSSAVHRALAVYAGHGMLPRWPLLMLDASVVRLREIPPTDVRLVQAPRLDPDFLAMDAILAGRGDRRQDHTFWLDERAGIPFWLERDGRRIGYAYIQRLFSRKGSRSPHGAFIGPVAVEDTSDMAPGVLALVARARDESDVLLLDIPGPNPSLPEVLNLGFQINYVTTFCATCDECFIDPRRYLPGDTVNF